MFFRISTHINVKPLHYLRLMKDFLKFSLKFYFKIQRQIPLNPTFEINDLTLLEEDFSKMPTSPQ